MGVWRVQLIFDLRRLGWVRLQQWLLCDSKSRTVMHLLMLCVPESVPRWVCLSHHHLWESDLWETTFTWVLKVKSKPSNNTLTSEGQQLQPLMNSIRQWEWKWPFWFFFPVLWTWVTTTTTTDALCLFPPALPLWLQWADQRYLGGGSEGQTFSFDFSDNWASQMIRSGEGKKETGKQISKINIQL